MTIPAHGLHCDAILFDLDGTLVDSAERIRRLWQKWSQPHGIPLDDILRVMHGRRAAETIRSVAPHLSAEEEVIALETDEISDMAGVKAYPGAIPLLTSLPPDRWAIVTSGSRRVAEARMRYVNLPIPDVFITAEGVQRGKPDPEGYSLAAHILGAPPDACIVIEDSPAGVRAGKAAGMLVVAVMTTHSEEVLGEADMVVSNLAALDLKMADRAINVRFRN